MGVVTKIEWADHTFNPWIGCTKVRPACDFCYADGRDIGAEVVRAGLAIADPRYGAAYRDEEAEARRARLGVWE